jgi:hypothetical protein
VKISLSRDGQAPAALNAPVIRGRSALVRAFVRPDAAFGMREAELRLVLKGPAGERVFTDRKVVGRASDETLPASTFNFTVPGDALGSELRYAVEVVTPAGCAAARSPAAGDQRVETTQTGTLKVTLVPIKYDADGSGRLPDLSEAQLKRYKDYLTAMYPVAAVELTVHPQVASTIALTEPNNWALMLDQMRALRAREAPPSDVYYYGLVNPASSGAEYCKGSCVAGIAYRASTTAAAQRAGLGLGFTSGTVAAETMAHELGHTHGRAHAPCGNVAGEDPSFPGGKGDVGVWGYNIVTAAAISPTNRKDIMGYCSPKWISDYTYAALAARGAAVNGVSVARLELGTPAKPTERRVLLLDEAGRPSWGIPTTEAPYGAPEPARVLDAAGAVLETITVHRTEVPDLGHASILVPAPKAGWASVVVDGAARPLSFAEVPAVPAFAR